jgi:hypothetical protein
MQQTAGFSAPGLFADFVRVGDSPFLAYLAQVQKSFYIFPIFSAGRPHKTQGFR